MAECLTPACRIERVRASEMRKGGLEPPRYCYRQPLKLDDLVCRCKLLRIPRTDAESERTAAYASDGFIRTHSHRDNCSLLATPRRRAIIIIPVNRYGIGPHGLEKVDGSATRPFDSRRA